LGENVPKNKTKKSSVVIRYFKSEVSLFARTYTNDIFRKFVFINLVVVGEKETMLKMLKKRIVISVKCLIVRCLIDALPGLLDYDE